MMSHSVLIKPAVQISCETSALSLVERISDTNRMEWTTILQDKATVFRQGDHWHLEFDDTIVPDRPQPGWAQYIRNTSARFKCSKCRRSWPSNRVMVVFHMRLLNSQGTVKVRDFRQNCKICKDASMEKPSIDTDNIEILLENLVKNIRKKCYHEDLGEAHRPYRPMEVNSPHEPSHCEGCLAGVCNRDTPFAPRNF